MVENKINSTDCILVGKQCFLIIYNIETVGIARTFQKTFIQSLWQF